MTKQEIHDFYISDNFTDMKQYIKSGDKDHTEKCLNILFEDYLSGRKNDSLYPVMSDIVNEMDFLSDNAMVSLLNTREHYGIYEPEQCLFIKDALNKTLMLSEEGTKWNWYKKFLSEFKTFISRDLDYILECYQDTVVINNYNDNLYWDGVKFQDCKTKAKVYKTNSCTFRDDALRSQFNVDANIWCNPKPYGKFFTISKEFKGLTYYWGVNNEWILSLVQEEINHYYNKVTANYYYNILRSITDENITINEVYKNG